jgi:hypothetical protein
LAEYADDAHAEVKRLNIAIGGLKTENQSLLSQVAALNGAADIQIQLDAIGERRRTMEQSSKRARRTAEIDDLKLKEAALEEKLASLANGRLLQQLEALKLENQELTAEIERQQCENRRLASELNSPSPTSSRRSSFQQRTRIQSDASSSAQQSPTPSERDSDPSPPSSQRRRRVTPSSPTLVSDYGQQGSQRSPVQSTRQRGNRPPR